VLRCAAKVRRGSPARRVQLVVDVYGDHLGTGRPAGGRDAGRVFLSHLDLLLDARCEFHEIYELLGAACGQLREAHTDNENGNALGAMIVVEDLLSTLGGIEAKVSEISAMTARWHGWASKAVEKSTL
jgi:hypothetical protein